MLTKIYGALEHSHDPAGLKRGKKTQITTQTLWKTCIENRKSSGSIQLYKRKIETEV